VLERWQRAYEHERQAHPVAWGRLIAPRIVILPSALARFYGGAVTWLRWICVGRDLVESAPDHVVRYVVAHEWGHVRRAHPAASLVMLACAIGVVLCPPTPQYALLGWSIGMAGLSVMVWATRLAREFEADDSAAQSVGSPGVREGLLWMIAHRGGMNPDRRARLVRTGWEAPDNEAAKQIVS
jgi:Zn-dependent protease with chaperone function